MIKTRKPNTIVFNICWLNCSILHMLLSTSLSRNKKETNYSLRLFYFLTLKSSNSDVASIWTICSSKKFPGMTRWHRTPLQRFKSYESSRWVRISKVNAWTILTPECQGTFPMTHLIRIIFIDKRKNVTIKLYSWYDTIYIKERTNSFMYGWNIISVEIRPSLM